jgi:hypothetical protein
MRCYLAGPTRLELATSGVTGRRSIHLNYDPARGAHYNIIPPSFQSFSSTLGSDFENLDNLLNITRNYHVKYKKRFQTDCNYTFCILKLSDFTKSYQSFQSLTPTFTDPNFYIFSRAAMRSSTGGWVEKSLLTPPLRSFNGLMMYIWAVALLAASRGSRSALIFLRAEARPGG